LNNPVSVQTVKDDIVAKGVYSKYVNEIMHFAVWDHAEHAEWCTEYGKEKYDLLVILIENERIRARQKRLKDGWMAMLRDTPNNVVFHVEQFTAAKVMVYISRQANQTTGRALSREGYGTKRSCIRHLVRCHNSKEHSEEFEAELGCVWKGFTRTTTTRKARARRRGTEHEDNDGDGIPNVKVKTKKRMTMIAMTSKRERFP
jgi:hypothetical protein